MNNTVQLVFVVLTVAYYNSRELFGKTIHEIKTAICGFRGTYSSILQLT